MSLVADDYDQDGIGIQLQKFRLKFEVVSAALQKLQLIAVVCFLFAN